MSLIVKGGKAVRGSSSSNSSLGLILKLLSQCNCTAKKERKVKIIGKH
jgi:hypothetical protein